LLERVDGVFQLAVALFRTATSATASACSVRWRARVAVSARIVACSSSSAFSAARALSADVRSAASA